MTITFGRDASGAAWSAAARAKPEMPPPAITTVSSGPRRFDGLRPEPEEARVDGARTADVAGADEEDVTVAISAAGRRLDDNYGYEGEYSYSYDGKIESGTCASSWVSAIDGGTCGETQYGCPSTACDDGDSDGPWCMDENLVNWFYCTPEDDDGSSVDAGGGDAGGDDDDDDDDGDDADDDDCRRSGSTRP